MDVKHFFLMLLVVCICCVSVSTVFGGSTPVFAEHVTNGSFDETWSPLWATEGTVTPANSDSAYPGLVFPNPSGDGWVMKFQSLTTETGDAGVAGGDSSWMDMLISAWVFVNKDTTYRHDTVIGGRMDLVTLPLYWGYACKVGYYTQNIWGGLSAPCWAFRPSGGTPQSPGYNIVYPNHGWHQVILVLSGDTASLYIDKTYAQVVADLNATTPSPDDTYSGESRTDGGVCFYTCYQDYSAVLGTGEPGYMDDIEVYLPPYTLATPTPTPTSSSFTNVTSSWTIYE
jgi:hypothetical protein